MWSGVKNPLAQKHLHAVKKGDRIFYYHTGDEKAVVGIAQALGDAYPDPKDKTGKRRGRRRGPGRRNSPRPVTLAEIKADPPFATSAGPHLAAVGDAGDRPAVGVDRKAGTGGWGLGGSRPDAADARVIPIAMASTTGAQRSVSARSRRARTEPPSGGSDEQPDAHATL